MRFRIALAALAWSLSSASAGAHAPVFEFGVGAGIAAGWTWIGEPNPARLELPTSGDRVVLPSLGGTTIGPGITLEARLLGHFAVEASVLYLRQSVDGSFELEGTGETLTITESVVHVPVLAKGIFPLGGPSGFLLLGPEFVRPGLSRVSAEEGGSLRAVASSEPAVWLTTGVGMELRVPIAAMDLRIPISLRFSFNPSASTALAERVTALPSDALVLDGTMTYRFSVVSSAMAFF